MNNETLSDHNDGWKSRGDLVPNADHPFPSGTRLRIHRSAPGLYGYVPEEIQMVETTIYWINRPQGKTARLSVFDSAETCTPAGFAAFNRTGLTDVNGWTSWFTGTVPGQIEKIGDDGPPPPPKFRWPSEDLKNLVSAAPTSPYTRALLRVKYNKPLPPEAVTLEAIEEFLAALPPVVAPARNRGSTPLPPPASPTRRSTDREQIDRGEYVEVQGRRDGRTYSTENWTKSGTVRVPLSVFEEGERAIKDFVSDVVDDMETDYGDTDYGDTEYDDFEIESDLDEAMEEAERMIAERETGPTKKRRQNNMNLIQHKEGLFERKDLGNGFVGDIPSSASVKQGIPEMRWTGARIPVSVWKEVVAFFQWSYAETKSETQVRLLFNPAAGVWKAHAFPQKYGTGMTTKELPDDPSYESQVNGQMAGGFIKFGTIHHHCSAGAFQSGTDSADEKEMGVHITVGNIGSERHSLHARVSLTILGTLGGDGKMLAPAKHAYYQAVLGDWIDVPEALPVFPEEIREKITGWVLGTPEVDTMFPAQWAANLIKEPVKVWEPKGYSTAYDYGEWSRRFHTGAPEEAPPATSKFPPIRDSDDYLDEAYEQSIQKFEAELEEIQQRSGFPFSQIHGVMTMPSNFELASVEEEVVHREIDLALVKHNLEWETYIYDGGSSFV